MAPGGTTSGVCFNCGRSCRCRSVFVFMRVEEPVAGTFFSNDLPMLPPEHWREQAWGDERPPVHVAAPTRSPIRNYQTRRVN